MSNENQTIHDFDFSLICEYFSHVQRQGPGSPEVTLQALSFIDNLTNTSKIADLGCGTGGQTMVLAQNAPGKITGIDLFPEFISIFNENAARLRLHESVEGFTGSMDNLSFDEESLDLIWCEGAIYNIGFVRGLADWKKYLKQGGYIAVSEASWFTDHRPAEIHEFWVNAYPEIDTIPVKVAQMQQAGYVPVATFILPEKCWTEHFFEPQIPVQELFLKQHAGNEMAVKLIEELRHEEAMYTKYKAYYGYVFYIGRKI